MIGEICITWWSNDWRTLYYMVVFMIVELCFTWWSNDWRNLYYMVVFMIGELCVTWWSLWLENTVLHDGLNDDLYCMICTTVSLSGPLFYSTKHLSPLIFGCVIAWKHWPDTCELSTPTAEFLNTYVGGLDCRAITTEFKTRVHYIHTYFAMHWSM